MLFAWTLRGEPLNRLVTWRERGNIDVATILSGSLPITAGNSETLTVTFPSGAATAQNNDKFYIELGIDNGAVITREITVAVGETVSDIAAKIQTALDASAPEVTPTVQGNVVTIMAAPGFNIDSFFTSASQQMGQRGGWVFINRHNWVNPLGSDPDQAGNTQEGDLQFTLENGLREIKTNHNNAWHTVYSEAEVKAWIAAGSQFQGTVEQSGHGVAGAIDLTTLPAQSALTAGEKAHYWIWVGTSGYQIPANSIGGAASAIDTSALSVGDWVIVAETQAGSGQFEYRVIPGDLMSRTVAKEMFSLKTWTAQAWPADSVVVYKGDVYRAPQGVQATDGAPGTPNAPWDRIDISGGLKVAGDDNGLPQTAPAGQVWIVISSAMAGGGQALYAYDHGSRDWEELGGGGVPMDLTPNMELIGVGTPVASVMAYAGKTLPDGWLLCDGGQFGKPIIQSCTLVLGSGTIMPDLAVRSLYAAVRIDRPFDHIQQTIQRGCRIPPFSGQYKSRSRPQPSQQLAMKWHGLNMVWVASKLQWGGQIADRQFPRRVDSTGGRTVIRTHQSLAVTLKRPRPRHNALHHQSNRSNCEGAVMADLKFVITDMDPNSNDYGTLRAAAPRQ